MSKKHFKAIAAQFRAELENEIPHANAYEQEPRKDTLRAMAFRFANIAQGFNPNFDRARFLAACGLGDTN